MKIEEQANANPVELGIFFETRFFKYLGVDGRFYGPLEGFPDKCPCCGSSNFKDKGSFEKCMNCGTRISPCVQDDVIVWMESGCCNS